MASLVALLDPWRFAPNQRTLTQRALAAPHLPAAESARIRQASWECLACIASGYYDKLPAYMQDIFSLTQRTVKGDEEEVVLQALELWCTVAEEEVDRDGVRHGGGGGGWVAQGAGLGRRR